MTRLPRPGWRERCSHFLLNASAFALCYQIANLLAHQQQTTRDIAFAFEKQIPFLPWMIIPYLCSGVFFVWSFVQVKTGDQLRLLSQRLLLATVCASFFFMLYPLRFSLPRPEMDSPLCAWLFQTLALFDKPYNQLPSLHIAYCVIFWRALVGTLPHSYQRWLLAGSLLLVALSTLFTYQHHLLDVVAGLLLGIATLLALRPGPLQPRVSFYYAIAASIVFLIGVVAAHSWLALYISISLLLVSWAYMRNNRFFLNKKNGRHSLLTWLLYAPYLGGYWLTWLAVQYRERRSPSLVKVSDQLWVGRRLTRAQARLLPADISLIDLSPELCETKNVPMHSYQHFPLLDLRAPETEAVKEIVAALQREIARGKIIYLHCAMGYSRSILLANYLTSATAQCREQHTE